MQVVLCACNSKLIWLSCATVQVGGFVRKVLRNMFKRLMPPLAEATAADAAAAAASGKVSSMYCRCCSLALRDSMQHVYFLTLCCKTLTDHNEAHHEALRLLRRRCIGLCHALDILIVSSIREQLLQLVVSVFLLISILWVDTECGQYAAATQDAAAVDAELDWPGGDAAEEAISDDANTAAAEAAREAAEQQAKVGTAE